MSVSNVLDCRVTLVQLGALGLTENLGTPELGDSQVCRKRGKAPLLSSPAHIPI